MTTGYIVTVWAKADPPDRAGIADQGVQQPIRRHIDQMNGSLGSELRQQPPITAHKGSLKGTRIILIRWIS